MILIFFLIGALVICLCIDMIDAKFMRCPKCKHLMRYHFNIEEDYGYWKCTKCGKEVRIYA